MPSDFRPLVDRVTARLTADPELRLEVRRELITHLRAAEAEHAAAGDADPASAAARSLGEPDALADQLWRTHRRRIRRRQWARRLTVAFAWPAGACVLAVLFVLLMRSAAPLTAFVHGREWATRQAWWPLAEAVGATPADRLAALPEDRRLQLPGAQDLNGMFDDVRRNARAAVERYPNDRALYAAHAGMEVSAANLTGSAVGGSDPLSSPDRLAAVLAVLDRGATLDPDNALYPLLSAQALARASSRQLRDRPADYYPYRQAGRDGGWASEPCWTLQIEDPATFARAVDAFRRAAAMPRLDDYAGELQARRMALLPPARDLGTQVMRLAAQWNTDSPAALAFDVNFTMAAHALDLAVAGRPREAEQLAADLCGVEAMTVRAVDRLGPAVFPLGFVNVGNGHAAAVLRATGHAAAADRFGVWADRQSAMFRDAFASRAPALAAPGGSSLETRVRALGRDAVRATAWAGRAEYALADQIVLAGGVATLLLLAATASTVAHAGSGHAGGRPALLLLPRPRELPGLLAAVAVPVVLYVAYVLVVPGGSRATGVAGRGDSLLAEYLLLGGAVVGASVLVARRAVLRRLSAVLTPRPDAGAGPTAGVVLWRCFVRPVLLLAGGIGVAMAIDHFVLTPGPTVTAGDRMLGVWLFGVAVGCASLIVIEIVRSGRARRLAGRSTGRGRNLSLGAVLLAVVLTAAVAYGVATDTAALIVAYVLLPMALGCGVIATVLAYMDDLDRLGRGQNVRVLDTLLRSVAARLAIAAVVAGGVGGLALRLTETYAVRQTESADGLTINPPIAVDAKAAAVRDFTLAGLREQRTQFDRLASGG